MTRGHSGAARGLAAVLAVAMAMAAPACKGKSKDAGGGGTASGTGTSDGIGSGTGSAPIPTPTGPMVQGQGAAITLPAGADASKITVTVKPPGDLPPASPEDLKRFAGVYQPIKTIELGPDGTQLAEPAVVSVTIPASALPAGRTLADVVAVSVATDGTLEDLRVIGVQGDAVLVEVHHFSFVLVAVAIGAIVATATMAVVMRGVTEPIMRKDCAKWLAPDDPKVQELAARTSIDPASGAIDLGGLALRGKNVDQGAHALRADQIIAKGEGDCVNMSTLFGSVLLAKGYPVRTVAGTATYDRGGKTYKGLHQWSETVIDGKGYYVDTFEPSLPRLIPMDQATGELKLERNRMCGKNPDGTALGPTSYDPKWIDGFTTDPLADKKQELEVLKAEHRKLNDDCLASKAGACTDRQSKYEDAKKLQEEINALEAAQQTP